jgi:hypothetical protein
MMAVDVRSFVDAAMEADVEEVNPSVVISIHPL